MRREQAQAAVEEAFTDGIKHLFEILVMNLREKETDAAGKFHNGIAAYDAAHAIASREIETIFPE